jgi:methionine-rich copper-binding protein CopC
VKKGKPDFANSYNVTVTPLEPGAYDVNWTGVAKDGHVMKGTLSFKIEP